MSYKNKTPQHIKIDEKNHVEESFLKLLEEQGWTVKRLEMQQRLTDSPIDKTEKVFGDYIDKYSMRQSIDDKVTLEIVYEGRTHNVEVPDKTGMDTRFADVFSDYNVWERLQILGYGSRRAYLEAKETKTAKAKDMVDHYTKHIFPNGFKAQVVATSQKAAVRYAKSLNPENFQKFENKMMRNILFHSIR